MGDRQTARFCSLSPESGTNFIPRRRNGLKNLPAKALNGPNRGIRIADQGQILRGCPSAELGVTYFTFNDLASIRGSITGARNRGGEAQILPRICPSRVPDEPILPLTCPPIRPASPETAPEIPPANRERISPFGQ